MDFIAICAVTAVILLIWDCIEVGKNDATNLVNAVFGSRVLPRKRAVLLAGVFVVIGATFASPVMETVRSGIFNPNALTPEAAISIFLSVYIVDTILLYIFSAFGMPVSTTATLVFSLAGGALAVTGSKDMVDWNMLATIFNSIFGSIVLTGILAFLFQRIFRGAIGNKSSNHLVVMTHGPWITGLMLTFLSWFLLVKGLKGFSQVKIIKETLFDTYGTPAVLMVYWAFLTFLTHLILSFTGRKGTKYLFHITAVVGMCAMAFAFGQNDLANCASPGLAALMIWKYPEQTTLAIPVFALFVCGLLMFVGMTTDSAQRVTRAEVNMASQHDKVSIWAPEWCKSLAKIFLKKAPADEVLAPEPEISEDGKKFHYDPLRASVIMAVGASVIAIASGMGIPVSTTYISFTAVVATGWGDRVYGRGDADVKLGRSIWVVTCWILGGFVAMISSGAFSLAVYKLGVAGIVGTLAINLSLRYYFSKRADRHEKTYHPKTPQGPLSTPPAH
jgi:phosphate/sulfate permease